VSKLAIVLFALLGCASNKSMPSQMANTGDDPRCEEFYEFTNKKWATNMEEFEKLKERAKKELGFHIENFYELLEVSLIPKLYENYKTLCIKAITCNQKEYCISYQYSNGDTWSFMEF